MSPTREELSAYIDGELAPSDMAKLAVHIEGSPELKRYIRDQERLRENLHAAFASLMAEPIPERLLRAAAKAPISFRLRVKEWASGPTAARSGTVLRFAVPATALVLGLFVGLGVERRATSSPDFVAVSATGTVVAQAELAQALDQQLASEAASNGPRIGVSFRSKSGADCRTFELAGSASSAAGVACHRGGQWQVGTLVTGAKGNSGTTYALASSEMPQAVRSAVAAEIAGEPYDAAAERRARDRGWH
jgi:anti-sigma factor RsiW